MGTIHIATGTASGPTERAAYDGALADVGIEGYNIVRYSSVIPALATVERVERIGDLGPVGHRLAVVSARAFAPDGEGAAAGLSWARREDGAGLFYEASAAGAEARTAVEEDLAAGLDHGLALREWGPDERGRTVATLDPEAGIRCAVAVAAYGRARSPW